MNLVKSEQGRWALEGELNRKTVPSLKSESLNAHHGDTGCCILDLSKIESIDSAGVAWLLSAKQHLGKKGIELQITHPPVQFTQLVKLAGVDAMLTVID